MRIPAALLLLALATLGAGPVACGSPPQVVEISPERGAQQVPSNAEVRIRFDRPVDQASVTAHFSTRPAAGGSVQWLSATQLAFRHQPFRAGTRYTVRLDAGYRDAAGQANRLNHSWSFTTEPAPVVTGSTPAAGEQNVDPSADLVLAFTRPMDVASVAAALTVAPAIRLGVTADPVDPRRVVVAPRSLLDAHTGYSVTLTAEARDVDGNPLARGVSVGFQTGDLRPLRHWVTFGTAEDPGESTVGIWAVDAHRQPREISSLPARSYSWSPDGTRLLVQGDAGAWAEVDLGGTVTRLPFNAGWAGFLAGGRGIAFLDGDRLQRYAEDGSQVAIDDSVGEVAPSPTGARIAYTVRVPSGTELRGYDVDLRAHYRIQAEAGSVDGLGWAPDGSRLAYRLATGEPGRVQVRVRDLGAGGRTLTVGVGELGPPAWLADSRHLVLSAHVAGPSGPVSRAFRLSALDGSSRPLAYADAIPSPASVPVTDPRPSPDGHTLAFLAPDAGGPQVWEMNADGTGLTRLTSFDPEAFPYSCRALGWTRS